MPGPALPTGLRPAVPTLAVSLGTACFGVLTTTFKVADGTHPWWDVALTTAAGYLFVAAGTVATLRRPGNRIGALMVLAGAASFAEDVQLSADPFVHTVGMFFKASSAAVVAHLMLAFPTGRVSGVVDRLIVLVAYCWSFGFMPLTVFFSGSMVPNLVLVRDLPIVTDIVSQFALLIAMATFVSLVRRWHRTGTLLRHALTPVVAINAAIALSGLGAALFWNLPPEGLYRAFIVSYQIAACLLPLAFLAGLLRIRLGRSAVSRLIEALNHPVSSADLRALLSRALGDPDLVVAYRRAEGPNLVTSDGVALAVPSADDPRRVLTDVVHNGQQVAVLVHNPALLEDEHVLRGVAAAAGLALENQRLTAELRAQLAEVRESRARIVLAGHLERERLEHDLHDGVQANLVASLISVRQAAEAAPDSVALRRATLGLDSALRDLRRISHGIRPAVLSEAGLEPALQALLAESGLEHELHADAVGALDPAAADTLYFVAAEAVANTLKHSGASRLDVRLERRDEVVRLMVGDDGVGGVVLGGRGGLQRLADRLGALGGTLRVDSPVGQGTTLVADVAVAETP